MQWQCDSYEEAQRAIKHMQSERGGAGRRFEIRSLNDGTKAVALVEVQNPNNEKGRQ